MLIPKVIATTLLAVAIFIKTDYSFFIFLKWYMFILSLICFSLEIEDKNNNPKFEYIFFIIIAILFNPFYFIPLWRGFWQIVDIIVILFFIHNVIKSKEE